MTSVEIYYDLQSFFYHDSDKNNILETHQLHPLIENLVDSESELKEFLKSNVESKQVWTQADDNQIVKLALFDRHLLYRLLVVRSVRLSFHDTKQGTILYDIAFSVGTNLPPQVKVYRLDESRIRMIDVGHMTSLEDTHSKHDFHAFEGGALEIFLKITPINTQKIYQILDKAQHELLILSSAEIYEDPIIRLRLFVEMLASPKTPGHLAKKIFEDTLKLMDAIYQSENYHINAIQTLSADPVAIQSLLMLRWQLFETGNIQQFPNIHKLLAEVLYKAETPIEEYQSPDAATIACTINNKQHLIKFISDKITLSQTIADVLQSDFVPDNIELYVNEMLTRDELNQLVTTDNQISPSTQLTFILLQQSELDRELDLFTFTAQEDQSLAENIPLRHIHPLHAEFLELHRFQKFEIKQDEAHSKDFVYLYTAKAKDIKDYRLIGFGLVYCNDFQNASLGCRLQDLNFNEVFKGLVETMQQSLQSSTKGSKPVWNRLFFPVLPIVNSTHKEVKSYVEEQLQKAQIKDLFLEKILFKIKLKSIESEYAYNTYLLEVKNLAGSTYSIHMKQLDKAQDHHLIAPATSIELHEELIRAKGGTWAYRIPAIIHHAADKFRQDELKLTDQSEQQFQEMDLDPATIVTDARTGSMDYNKGELVEVSRPFGQNQSGVVIGLLTNDLHLKFPVKRLLIIGDITHVSRGAITAQECTRINAAIRYAVREKIPIDWFSASYGVEIKLDKGVESLDASSSTTREIIQNCHHKGLHINLVIDETNIGAQSYWDALATIVHEAKGLLIMTPRGCMALTGPNALVSALYSAAHSLDIPAQAKELYAKGLQSLSGYHEIHGPNSDAMLVAKDLEEACEQLIRHHYLTYKKPGQKMAAKRPVNKKAQKKEVKESVNKEISKITKGYKPHREMILDALRDDGTAKPLHLWKDAKGTRWQTSKKGDLPQEPTAIVQEMLIGAQPTLVIFTPSGPLTPADADIISRAIYKADQQLPVLIIGSLTGFTCDPLSMENHQLIAGASIAKAIVDHRGPILIVNLGNLVGGTFVVFSKQLNPDLDILALEGSRVQVIGGKAAAKVVFHSKICKLVDETPEVRDMATALSRLGDKSSKRSKHEEEASKDIDHVSQNKFSELEHSYNNLRRNLIAELENKEGAAFDSIHNVQRAVDVGSVDAVVALKDWRQTIVDHLASQVERYLKRPKHQL